MAGSIKRIFRGIEFAFQSFFVEKPRGLDFSMRYKFTGDEGSHGYALTPKKSFRNLMKNIEVLPDDAFIDIGCGKGGTAVRPSL